MEPGTREEQSRDYYLVEQAIHYLAEHFQQQPSLPEIARAVHLSPYHFQRLFTRWAGISPKRFLQFLTIEYAKGILDESKNLLEACYGAGLSSPGRLHDLFVNLEAVTPGAYKHKGAGLHLRFGFHPTPFGRCLLALTDKGICSLYFIARNEDADALSALKENWPGATLEMQAEQTGLAVETIFSRPAKTAPGERVLNIHLRGTNFQVKVWEALLRIPPGKLLCYGDLAAHLGNRRASRAVAGAVGRNPVSYLVPCHRVIRKVGKIGGYRWGAARKMALLGWEAANEERKTNTRKDPGS